MNCKGLQTNLKEGNNMKKAQLAVETLLIYGAALLIVMLAIAALFGTGLLNFDSFIGDSCSISQELQCSEYSVTATLADDQIQLEIQNTLGSNVKINSITLEGKDDYVGIFERCPLTDIDMVIPSGDKTVFKIGPCSDLTNFIGKKVKATIEVNWNRVNTEINKTAYGQLRATISK